MFSSEMDRRIIILILTVASTIAQTGLSDTEGTVSDPPKVESDNRMFVCYLDRQDSGSKDYYRSSTTVLLNCDFRSSEIASRDTNQCIAEQYIYIANIHINIGFHLASI